MAPLLGSGIISVQIRAFRLETINISKIYIILFMSLISQQDRKLAIEALDFYLFSKGNDFTEAKRAEVNALLNWIKIEKSKHEH